MLEGETINTCRKKGDIMTLQELYDSVEDKNLTIKVYYSDDEELYQPSLENVAEYFDEIVIY